jgi:deoxyadenosine/deoxycytidine kinase
MTIQARIGVVGPCAAGKSTLINRLKEHGYNARHIAQEHSYVPDMWQRITQPDLLIYLDVSYPVSMKRRKLDWRPEEFQEQLNRLQHARQHADLFLQTDRLTVQEVFEQVVHFINKTLENWTIQ